MAKGKENVERKERMERGKGPSFPSLPRPFARYLYFDKNSTIGYYYLRMTIFRVAAKSLARKT
jgi:hypothetical protein